MKLLKTIVLSIVVVLGLLITGVKLKYGNGEAFPEIATAPTIPEEQYQIAIETEFPPGMVAADPNSDRLFFTYHFLHQPERAGVATLYELIDGKGQPFPSSDPEIQRLFDRSMGVIVDRQGRLWIVIPGGTGGVETRLLAIDINSKEIIYEHTFEGDDAAFGQDMRVSSDGKKMYFADTGFLDIADAYIGVFDIDTRKFRKALVNHSSVSAQNYKLLKRDGSTHGLAWGLLDFRVGVDGISISADDKWLYYAAMTNDSAYRIETRFLNDESLDSETLATKVEKIGEKPSSDAIELDANNNLIITNALLGGLSMITPQGEHVTLVENAAVSWSDSVTVAKDGSIYYTDSELATFLDQSGQPADIERYQSAGPFQIYRVQPNPTR